MSLTLKQKRAFDKIAAGLRDAIEGRVVRTTRVIITDLRNARRIAAANGVDYTWEMVSGRPTGRCIVKIVDR